MKNIYFLFTTVFVSALQLVCCGDICPSKYTLELPNPPESWVSLLGEPCWRVEWFDQNGENRRAELKSGENLEVEIPITWANPVIARPYWPEHGLNSGIFMPAGALFPFDAKKDAIRLSWEAGRDAVFYMELIFANEQNSSKIPANFDWPRFRELFSSDVLGEAVRKDPWLIDWRSVAEKTISGNFDRRRLVPKETKPKVIPDTSGIWYGTSPFAEPLVIESGEDVFPVSVKINVWVSSNGILWANSDTWILYKWKN
jgi:hypothetical protein